MPTKTATLTDGLTSPPVLVPPRFGTPRNPLRETLGGEVAEVARRLRKPLMPWQRHSVDVALELDPETGELWYEEVVITVPRQSGKTTLILAILVWRCIAMALRLGPQTCTYLAQTGKMARRKLEREFARIMRHARSLREIPKMSRQIPQAANEWKLSMNNGSEHISFGTGSYLQIEAPTEDGSHGDVLDMPVIDEAFSHDTDAVEQAVDAATVTRRSPQSFIVSTAGNEKSIFLARKVLAGRKSCDDPLSRTCYLEWSVPDDEKFDDPEVWARYLPALGHTITLARLLARLDKAKRNPDEVDEDGFEPGIAGFRRGYLNQWPKFPALGAEADVGPISMTRWNALVDGDSKPREDRVEDYDDIYAVRIALDVPPEQTTATFSIAGKRADGLMHVDIRRHVKPEEMGQLVVLAKALTDGHNTSLILPPSSPAKGWREQFEAAKVPLDILTPAEYAEACSAMSAAVINGSIRHRGQPEMTAAVAGLDVKSSGDVDVWSRRKSSVNIAPFVAATCALVRVPQATDKVEQLEGSLMS